MRRFCRVWVGVMALIGCGGGPVVEQEPPALPSVEAPREAPEAVEEKAPIQSGVEIVSLKNGSIEDAHTLSIDREGLYLGLPDNPASLGGEVRVDLASWSSPIPPRDDRVKEVFFKVADYPTARFTVEAASGFGVTAIGASSVGEVTGTFEVSGGSFSATLKVAAERTSEEGWVFRTVEPLVFTAAQLGASDRVQEVAALCGVGLADDFKLSMVIEKKP